MHQFILEVTQQKKTLESFTKLKMSQRDALAAKKTNCMLAALAALSADERTTTGESTPGVPCSVLGSSVQETHGHTEKSPERNMMKGLDHLSYEERLSQLGPFSLENRSLIRDLTNIYEYKEQLRKENRPRLFSVGTCERTRSNGQNQKHSFAHAFHKHAENFLHTSHGLLAEYCTLYANPALPLWQRTPER
ncbi:hypothetical protein BTVI_97182 [Pitangus sulphuratus]|nr:hypothetical protein BTVI_97182 [Pitangus sulphuratus]